jgi:hypothetical protein
MTIVGKIISAPAHLRRETNGVSNDAILFEDELFKDVGVTPYSFILRDGAICTCYETGSATASEFPGGSPGFYKEVGGWAWVPIDGTVASNTMYQLMCSGSTSGSSTASYIQVQTNAHWEF